MAIKALFAVLGMIDSTKVRLGHSTGMQAARGSTTVLACLALLCMTAGCSQTMPDREIRMTRSYLYYLDGAGGGKPLSNWSGGIRQGLQDAGYNGAGEMFSWNTGLGVVADQDSSVEYKRSKAAELAQQIQPYTREHPGAPVTLIGLSAGTAVAVFTLEALPVGCPVNNVILLGASISATYDLTQALQRVSNRMYVFTSEKDAVLAFLVPSAGTADRQQGVPSAGLYGFQVPPGASAATRTQYAKISYIGWRPEFEQAGNFGGHTDTVKAPFVQEYIAPLIMQAGARRIQPTTAVAARMIQNPDYGRWAGFAPGSWATFEGHQIFDGVRRPVRMTAKLVSRHQDRVVIERTYVMLDAGSAEPLRVQTFVATANILPEQHPLTCPTAKIVNLPGERLTVAGRPLECEVRTVDAKGQFLEWGSDVSASICGNRQVPGGVVRVSLKSHKGGEPFEFDGQVVAYGVPPGAARG
jgi:pimeloyl-ACP methyl ester carboxylesterase